jgi:raffinose/stachyose/melibiose transport system permease protein
MIKKNVQRSLLRENDKSAFPTRGFSIKRFMYSPASLNLMYLPALILFAVFIYYPVIQGINFSFTNWNGYSADYAYVGFEK